MKRKITLSLTVLLLATVFIMWAEPSSSLKVEAASETIDSELLMDEVILKVEEYLSEYSKEFPADDLTIEKINPKEYLIKKLEEDHFTEEEIGNVFGMMAEKRQEELIDLIEVYLDKEPLLSKNAMISKLEEDTYRLEEIEAGLEIINTDWQEQAVKASEEYINSEIELDDGVYSIISRKSLFQYLVAEKEFSLEEATYGVGKSVINWEEQAFKQAQYYLEAEIYSKKSLIKMLISDEFTKEEAEYGVAQTETNWKDQAMKKAENYMDQSSFQSKKKLLDYLQQAGFSNEETEYALNLIFEVIDEPEVEEPVEKTPEIIVPERPIIIKPIEFITNRIVISAQAATSKGTDSKDLSLKKSGLPSTKKTQILSQETPGAEATEEVEDAEELEETSLFDNPVFTPVVMVLIVGNLYLFQKT